MRDQPNHYGDGTTPTRKAVMAIRGILREHSISMAAIARAAMMTEIRTRAILNHRAKRPTYDEVVHLLNAARYLQSLRRTAAGRPTEYKPL